MKMKAAEQDNLLSCYLAVFGLICTFKVAFRQGQIEKSAQNSILNCSYYYDDCKDLE